MFEAIFDQERSGKNLSQSTRGSLISGTKSNNEHPGTWSGFAKKMMSQSTRGFSISEVKARKKKLNCPGLVFGKKLKIKLK